MDPLPAGKRFVERMNRFRAVSAFPEKNKVVWEFWACMKKLIERPKEYPDILSCFYTAEKQEKGFRPRDGNACCTHGHRSRWHDRHGVRICMKGTKESAV
jgi:hypothetical protein